MHRFLSPPDSRETGVTAIRLPASIRVTIGDEARAAVRLVVEPR